MQSNRGIVNQLLATRFLGRIGDALILLFLVNIGFGLFPLRLTNPAWQETFGLLFRSSSLFALLGCALIFLCESQPRVSSPPLFPLRRIQKLAPLAALGFLLLIPLQINSMYLQIRDSDNAAQKTIRQVERQVNLIRSLNSLAEFQQFTKNLPPQLQPMPGASLIEARSRLVDRGEDELARLRIAANKAKSDMVRKAVPDAIRDSLACLIYAFAFYGIRTLDKAVITAAADQISSGD